MPRDVASRTLQADPTEDMHAATKQYVDNLVDALGDGLPVNEDANTLVPLGFIGPARFAFWGGVVDDDHDPVTIIPDDANDVSQCLSFMSICFSNYASSGGSPHVGAYVFTQAGQPQGWAPGYDAGHKAQLIPGGNAAVVMQVKNPISGDLLAEVQINVESDGSVVLTRTQSLSGFYFGLLLMWI